MKIIVTHTSPDWDAIGSVWLIRTFLSGWHEAAVEFVPAGQTSERRKTKSNITEAIETFRDSEIIHVDTGLGPLDHHQTSDPDVCAASRTWDYVKKYSISNSQYPNEETEKQKVKEEAISRIVKVLVAIDHFREVFWENPTADYHEFSLIGVLEGLKFAKPEQDDYYVSFGIECLNALLHNFENRIWAEKEIANDGKQFTTRWGKGIGFETLNDTVLKLAQKMGFILVVRKDPRKGYVRIKARPTEAQSEKLQTKNEIDLTLAYEKLSKIDPEATWYLHVSKKMLLNGTPKNPKMVPTKVNLEEIIKVLEKI